MSVVGIDFGNENCVIAAAQKGGVDVLSNEVSSRQTPTMVAFGEKERYLGEPAKSQYLRNMKNTISDIKRLIGHSWGEEEAQKEIANMPFKVVEMPNHDVGVEVTYEGEQRVFSLVAIAGMLFQKLKDTAEKALQRPVKDVVISVPGFWTDKQRHAMLDAAVIGNLNPLRIMSDSAASALAYGIYKTNLSETDPIRVLFFDQGQTSTSATVVEFVKGKLKVLGCAYDRSLGGRNFDAILLEHFLKEFQTKYKIDVASNARAKKRLQEACEKLKKSLNQVPEAPIGVDNLMNDIDVKGFMKKEEFEQLAQPLLERALLPLKQVLEDTGLKAEDLFSVELIGGSSRLNMLKKAVGDLIKREPSQTLNAEEAVARGCALQCAILSPLFKVRDFSIIDIYPYPMRITWKTPGSDEMVTDANSQELFVKNNPIPCPKMITFNRTEPLEIVAEYSQPSLLPPGTNTFVGKFLIPNISSKNGEPAKVRVKVKLDIHGVFAFESSQLIETVEEVPAPTKVDESAEVKKEETPTEPMEEDSKKDATPESPEQTPAKPEEKAPEEKKEEAKKKKVRRIDLNFEEHTNGLTEKERQLMCEEEARMAASDKLATETAEKKNAVESYVYDMRSKLSDSLASYAADAEKEMLLKLCNDSEEWLYGDGEDETKSAYTKKLEELTALGDPIKKRFFEHEHRIEALNSLRSSIQRFELAATSKDPKYDHIPEEEMQKITSECSTVQKWITENVQKQDQLPRHVDPVITVEQINRKRMDLERFCNPILNKPKPKPKVETPKEPEKKETEKKEEGKTEEKAPEAEESKPAPTPETPTEMDLD